MYEYKLLKNTYLHLTCVNISPKDSLSNLVFNKLIVLFISCVFFISIDDMRVL